jgi:predicted component of type VI protein secretion system
VSAQLFVLSGADVGRSLEARDGATIGRSRECALVLRDPSISRRHAHLEERGGSWFVVDDGSRNGIATGAVRHKRLEIADGSEFVLGEVLLRFRSLAPAVAAPPAPTAAPARAPDAPPAIQGTGMTNAARAAAAAPTVSSELVLEEAHEIELASTVVRPPAAAPAARPASSAARGQGLAEQRGRILQYHRAPEGGSAFSFELEQLPAWQRYALYALGLILLAAAAAAAFFGAAFIKERLSGGSQPAPEIEAPAAPH